MGTVEDIFNSEPVETVAEQPVETPQPETPAEPVEGAVRDEKGRFAPKGVNEDAPPASDKLPQDVYEPLRVVRDENRQLKEELAAIRQRLEQPQQPPAPPPTIWEDEQGWQQHFSQQVTGQAAFNARLDTSEMLMAQAHDDFDDLKAEFLQMAEANPAIAQEALQDKHPWRKAYQIAKNARTMKDLGATDIDSLKATLLEQARAEVASQAPQAPALPDSLAGAQSARGNNPQAIQRPLSIEDIIRG
jgi:hypothetical protein